MITPTNLKARREAMGVSRELVASFGPRPTIAAANIRDQERAKHFRVYRWHIAAIEGLEDFLSSGEFSELVNRVYCATVEAANSINDAGILWTYSDAVFQEHCPFKEQALCRMEIYTIAAMQARDLLINDGHRIIDAEFLPDRYEKFRADLGIEKDLPEHRAKWWRHWSAQFQIVEE